MGDVERCAYEQEDDLSRSCLIRLDLLGGAVGTQSASAPTGWGTTADGSPFPYGCLRAPSLSSPVPLSCCVGRNVKVCSPCHSHSHSHSPSRSRLNTDIVSQTEDTGEVSLSLVSASATASAPRTWCILRLSSSPFPGPDHPLLHSPPAATLYGPCFFLQMVGLQAHRRPCLRPPLSPSREQQPPTTRTSS